MWCDATHATFVTACAPLFPPPLREENVGAMNTRDAQGLSGAKTFGLAH